MEDFPTRDPRGSRSLLFRRLRCPCAPRHNPATSTGSRKHPGAHSPPPLPQGLLGHSVFGDRDSRIFPLVSISGATTSHSTLFLFSKIHESFLLPRQAGQCLTPSEGSYQAASSGSSLWVICSCQDLVHGPTVFPRLFPPSFLRQGCSKALYTQALSCHNSNSE